MGQSTSRAVEPHELPTTEIFVPEKLRYRPHLKWVYYAFLGFAALQELLAIVFAATYFVEQQIGAGLFSLAVFSLLPLILALEARYLLRPLAFSYVQIYPDRFVLHRRDRVVEFPFADIREVKLSHLPYAGGWFAVRCEGQPVYRFTVVLRKSASLLEAIAVARPGLIDEKKFFKYRRTAVFADQSWERLYERARAWPWLAARYWLMPLALASPVLLFATGLSSLERGVVALAWFGINLMVGIFLYVAEDVVIGFRFRRAYQRGETPNRNPDFERSVQWWTTAAHVVIALALFGRPAIKVVYRNVLSAPTAAATAAPPSAPSSYSPGSQTKSGPRS